jgi:hypothetical protein
VFNLCLAESAGGVGLGLAEAALVFEELGRALVPGPLVASHLAAGLVDGADDGAVVVGLIEPGAGGRRSPLVVEHLDDLDVLLVLSDGGDRLRRPRRGDATRLDRPMDPLTPVWAVDRLPAGTRWPDPTSRRGGAGTAPCSLPPSRSGSAAWSTELAVEYAKQRKQFGRPIGGFQAVKHLCADMAVRTEVARCAVHAAAVTVDQPDVGDPTVAAAGAKLLADEAAVANGRSCIQVHGGMGFTWEVPAHLAYKRARVLATQFGTDDQLAESLAESLAASRWATPIRRPTNRTATGTYADPVSTSPSPARRRRHRAARGRTVYGMQLPIQSQSTIYAQPWERSAGPDELAAVALACEAAGFFYVGVCDHTFIPDRLAAAMSTTWYDTVATLGLAGRGHHRDPPALPHLRDRPPPPPPGGQGVRHPRRAVGGRVICGVGAGHVAEEFDLMGPAFDHRGPVTDEAIAGLAAGWSTSTRSCTGPDGRRRVSGSDRGRCSRPGHRSGSADRRRPRCAGPPALPTAGSPSPSGPTWSCWPS